MIEKVWIKEGRIWITTAGGRNLSRPLEAFPRLLDATEEQRGVFEMGADGEDIRWEEIDKTLLSRYIYGIKRPSEQRKAQILDAIRALGREISSIYRDSQNIDY